MIRPKCRKRGHAWVQQYDGYRPPVQFCGRWLCDGERVAPWLYDIAPTLAATMRDMITLRRSKR